MKKILAIVICLVESAIFAPVFAQQKEEDRSYVRINLNALFNKDLRHTDIEDVYNMWKKNVEVMDGMVDRILDKKFGIDVCERFVRSKVNSDNIVMLQRDNIGKFFSVWVESSKNGDWKKQYRINENGKIFEVIFYGTPAKPEVNEKGDTVYVGDALETISIVEFISSDFEGKYFLQNDDRARALQDEATQLLQNFIK